MANVETHERTRRRDRLEENVAAAALHDELHARPRLAEARHQLLRLGEGTVAVLGAVRDEHVDAPEAREPLGIAEVGSVGELAAFVRHLRDAADLLEAEPPSRRAALEIALDRAKATITDTTNKVEDELASGARLDEVRRDRPVQLRAEKIVGCHGTRARKSTAG